VCGIRVGRMGSVVRWSQGMVGGARWKERGVHRDALGRLGARAGRGGRVRVRSGWGAGRSGCTGQVRVRARAGRSCGPGVGRWAASPWAVGRLRVRCGRSGAVVARRAGVSVPLSPQGRRGTSRRRGPAPLAGPCKRCGFFCASVLQGAVFVSLGARPSGPWSP
jgi:hypothetical protein